MAMVKKHPQEDEVQRTEEYMDAFLAKLKRQWRTMPKVSFMWMLCEHVAEEDTFWESDEGMLMRLDGKDPYDEDDPDGPTPIPPEEDSTAELVGLDEEESEGSGTTVELRDPRTLILDDED